ncbi:MAG: aldose epimerase [Ilumatobacteraceae bacterium]
MDTAPTDDPEPSTAVAFGSDRITVTVEPSNGGRIARLEVDGVDMLVTRDSAPETHGPLAWGSYPMVPWCGRIRAGTFHFRGRRYELPLTLGRHAIHGVGFTSPWVTTACDDRSVDLELVLPSDARWPFGGVTRQHIAVVDDRVVLDLSVTADDRPFPAALGWHPWFRKPDRLDVRPTAMYRRDDDWITIGELGPVTPPPWDDCFRNDAPVRLTIDGVHLELWSPCTTWVVYDMPPHATCVEPQTGPPDALNIAPEVVGAGATLSARFEIRVIDAAEHPATDDDGPGDPGDAVTQR